MGRVPFPSVVCVFSLACCVGLASAAIPAPGPADLPDSASWGDNISVTTGKLAAGQAVRLLFSVAVDHRQYVAGRHGVIASDKVPRGDDHLGE